MTYKRAAAEQKILCEKGRHVHSAETTPEVYVLVDPRKHPESMNYECCPCFGCCVPELRKTVQ